MASRLGEFLNRLDQLHVAHAQSPGHLIYMYMYMYMYRLTLLAYVLQSKVNTVI